MPELPEAPQRLLPAPPGGFERDFARGRQRRRRRTTGVSSTAFVLLAASGLVIALRGGGDSSGPSQLTPAAPPSVSATPTPRRPPLSLSQRTPRYLPPGVTLSGSGLGNDPNGGVSGTAYYAHYEIAGYANSHDNLGEGLTLSIFDTATPKCGPRADRAPTQIPNYSGPPTAPCTDVPWIRPFVPIAEGVQQEIHGRQAHVLAPANGYGPFIVEWHEGTVHYVLSEERLNTPAGQSGIPIAELVKMAKSIPIDPTVPPGPAPTNPPDATFDPAIIDNVVSRADRIYVIDTAITDPSKAAVGARVDYFPTPGNSQMVAVAVLNHPRANLLTNDFGLRTATSTVRIRNSPATLYASPSDNNGTIVGLLWRMGDATIVVTGSRGITIEQLIQVAGTLQVKP